MTASDKQFGPYRLVRQIATGGMAEIYLAKTKGIGGFEKFVALKLIHPNFSEDEHFIEMLVDEAKISVQLQHVNIAQIFDLGRVGNTYYITMEFIDGADLFKLLRTVSEADNDFPIDVACYIAKEVCAGLDYAHRRRDPETGQSMGIVHRDVSPQNVLISQAGEVKIVDFGIAKAALRARQTAAGVIKGKYYYMSPEQAWGDPVDHRTDIFSAGILLYEMLAGQMLYLEDNVSRLLDLVRKADIAPPSSKRRGVPKELDDIVMKALRKKAGDRYMTAQDFQIALERFIYSTTPNFSTTRIAQFMRQVSGTTQAPVGGLPEAKVPSRPEPPLRAEPPPRAPSRPEPRAPEPRAPEPRAPEPREPRERAESRPRPPDMSTEQRGFFRDIEAAGNPDDTGGFQAGQLARSRSEFVDENSMIFRMAQGRIESARPGGGRSPGEDTRDVGEDTDAGEGRLTDVGDRLGRKMNDVDALAVHGAGSGEFPGEATQITGPPGFGGGFNEGPGRSRTSETAVAEPPQRRRAGSQLDAEPPTLDLPAQGGGGGGAGWREPPKRTGLPLREGAVSLRDGAAALRPPARYAPAQQSGGAPGDEEPRFSVKRRGKQPEVVTGEVADEEGPTRIDPAKPGAGAGSGTGSAGQGMGSPMMPMAMPPMPPPSPSLAPPQMQAGAPLAQQPTAIQVQPGVGVHVSVPGGPPPPPPGAMGGRGMPLPPAPPPQLASPVIPLVPPHLVAAQMQARSQSQQPFDFPFVDPTRPPGSVPLVDLNAPAQRTTSVAPMGALLPQVPNDLPGGTGNGRPRDAYSAAIPGSVGKFNTYSLEVDEMPSAYKLPRAGGKRNLTIVLVVLAILAGALLGFVFLRPHGSSTARMEITSQPLGARVAVNGKPQDSLTPVTITGLRRASSYHIVMELDRYERWDTDQEIGKEQSTVRVVGVMQPITGTLKVSTIPPGANITVNGLAQGPAPLERKIEPAPAPAPFDPRNPLPDLIIEVALDGYKTERHIVQWEGKRTLEVSYPLEVQK